MRGGVEINKEFLLFSEENMWCDWSPEGINYSLHSRRPPAAAAVAAESQTETNIQIQEHEMMLATPVCRTSHWQLICAYKRSNCTRFTTAAHERESWILGRTVLWRVFKLCFHFSDGYIYESNSSVTISFFKIRFNDDFLFSDRLLILKNISNIFIYL